jgi:hypothetical protein
LLQVKKEVPVEKIVEKVVEVRLQAARFDNCHCCCCCMNASHCATYS